MKKEITIQICCGLLIFLFLYTGLSKLTEFTLFTHDLYNQPFARPVIPYLRWTIPAIEITTAIFLSIKRTRLIGLLLSLAVMLLFTIYTSLVLLHFFEWVPCSCGGVLRFLSWPQHLIFNLIFTFIAIIGLTTHRKLYTQNIQYMAV